MWYRLIRKQTTLSHDPKLKACMAEIKKVMQRYECGGYVSLVSKTHGEFELELPPWCGLFWLRDGKGVRVKLKAKERETAELTAHLVFSLRDTIAYGFGIVEKIADVLGKSMEIDHKPLHDFESEDR